MERGQITIPVEIRKKLNITPKTWLWIKLIKNKILIEPVQEETTATSLQDFLLADASDNQIYWTKEDDEALKKIRKKSQKRLKDLAK